MNKLHINIPGKGKVVLASVDPAFKEPQYPVTIMSQGADQVFQFEGLFTRKKQRIPRKLKKRIKTEWAKWAVHHLTHLQ